MQRRKAGVFFFLVVFVTLEVLLNALWLEAVQTSEQLVIFELCDFCHCPMKFLSCGLPLSTVKSRVQDTIQRADDIMDLKVPLSSLHLENASAKANKYSCQCFCAIWLLI